MSIIDAARDAADRLLLRDRCTVTRQGEKVWDDDQGKYVVTPVPVAEDLPCNLTPFTGAGILAEAFGGETVNTRTYRLAVRWDAPEIKEEDTVTVTESADPLLEGREFRVEHPEAETFQTARRLIVESIRPSEEP